MLGQIRRARVNFKTGIVILGLGLVFWGVFAYANIKDFVPSEFLDSAEDRAADPLSEVTPVDVGEGGVLPDRWAAGVDCAREAPFQVHEFDADFFIIRQSKCENYEAPFLFLFFGEERALLMDTGAVPGAALYDVVMGILEQRAAEPAQEPVPLVVAHTHSHGDHTSADATFANAVGVQTVVGLSVRDVQDFWRFDEWPNDRPTFDLGGRVFDVIAIPGHHATSIALYDRRTGVLLTGDSVYPGHLFVPSAEAWPLAVASVERLVAFAEAHPVQWVLGNHIEMTDRPFEPYPYGAAEHPDERALHFTAGTLREIAQAMRAMGDEPRCEVHEDFVIQPTYVCGFDEDGR